MKNVLIIVLLSLLGIASSYFLRHLETELSEINEEKITRKIAIAYDIESWHFNTNNQLQYALVSNQVIEYSNEFGTEFSMPHLTAYDEKDNKIITWKGKANQGFLAHDKSNLTLIDKVKMIEYPDTDKALYINGSIMDYNTETRLVTSNQPVTINDGVITQVSDNLSLHTQKRQLDSKKRVRAVYQTAKKK